MPLFRQSPTIELWIDNEVDPVIRPAVLGVLQEGVMPLSLAYEEIAQHGRRGMAQLIEVVGITGPQDTEAAVAVAQEMELDEALHGLFGYLLRMSDLRFRYRKFFERGSKVYAPSLAERYDTAARVAAIECLIALTDRVPTDSEWRPAFERVAREYVGWRNDSNLDWSVQALARALHIG